MKDGGLDSIAKLLRYCEAEDCSWEIRFRGATKTRRLQYRVTIQNKRSARKRDPKLKDAIDDCIKNHRLEMRMLEQR